MAYSSIGHMGYALAGVATGNISGSNQVTFGSVQVH